MHSIYSLLAGADDSDDCRCELEYTQQSQFWHRKTGRHHSISKPTGIQSDKLPSFHRIVKIVDGLPFAYFRALPEYQTSSACAKSLPEVLQKDESLEIADEWKMEHSSHAQEYAAS